MLIQDYNSSRIKSLLHLVCFCLVASVLPYQRSPVSCFSSSPIQEFSTDSQLILHVGKVHGLKEAMKVYACHACNKAFRSSAFLKLHREKYHADEDAASATAAAEGVVSASASSPSTNSSMAPVSSTTDFTKIRIKTKAIGADKSDSGV